MTERRNEHATESGTGPPAAPPALPASPATSPASATSPSPALPLAGITVVSVEQAVAAPYATRQLADLGARAIKVERPGSGDSARRYDTTVHGESGCFGWLNRSKESLTPDLKSPAGRQMLERLLGRADVFVQNPAPGAAARMDLGADAPRERFPSLIPRSITPYRRPTSTPTPF